ncbi:hypothetical protein PFLUV_G00043160 [Perca fluviatilis]|uniref:Uncharacterized protein n=1 Tax=Perca fluviatilis TaxID=8168 RepID=A0A6A5FFK2_PERFL|nr:hypothetical protein PFLUV_G00043160 [Perca fluviatilis]
MLLILSLPQSHVFDSFTWETFLHHKNQWLFAGSDNTSWIPLVVGWDHMDIISQLSTLRPLEKKKWQRARQLSRASVLPASVNTAPEHGQRGKEIELSYKLDYSR